MIQIHIDMPSNAGMSGLQTIELPAVPRIGEVIKDVNNRFYKITAVVYQPFEQSTYPKIKLEVVQQFATSGFDAIDGGNLSDRM
jgi:hypothetical protein